jgi:hypothetical protein
VLTPSTGQANAEVLHRPSGPSSPHPAGIGPKRRTGPHLALVWSARSPLRLMSPTAESANRGYRRPNTPPDPREHAQYPVLRSPTPSPARRSATVALAQIRRPDQSGSRSARTQLDQHHRRHLRPHQRPDRAHRSRRVERGARAVNCRRIHLRVSGGVLARTRKPLQRHSGRDLPTPSLAARSVPALCSFNHLPRPHSNGSAAQPRYAGGRH